MNFYIKEYYKTIRFRYENVSLNIFKENNRRDIFIIAIITKRIKIINNNKRYSNIFKFYDVKNRDK